MLDNFIIKIGFVVLWHCGIMATKVPQCHNATTPIE